MSNTKKVKIKENGTLEFAPTKVFYEGSWVFNPCDEILDKLGYKTLIETTPLPEKEGYQQIIGYVKDGDCVIEQRSYRQIIDPTIGHRKLSKGFLRIALIKLGYIDQFENLLKTMEIPLGDGKTLNGYVAWNDFLTIDEDSEMFAPVIRQVRRAFNLTDEQYEDIIKNCISKV